jgi:hypothetical protein
MIHINYIRRRAVWTLLALCLAFSVAADSYHPHILKSQVVTLDAAAIERYAQSGTPFDLVFGETRLSVALWPAPVAGKEGLRVLEVAKDGSIKERIVADNITYAGDVVGEDPEASEARFTIANDVLEGYVLSSTGWWWIEPLTRFDPKAGSGKYLVYATRDLDFAIDYGDDGVDADTVYEPYGGPPSPDRRIPVVMVADYPYATYTGSVPYEARHATLINMINGIYRRETGRQFRIVVSIADFGNTFLQFTNAHALLTRLKLFVDFAGGGVTNPNGPGLVGLINLHAYFAHLTVGKDMDENVEGVGVQNGRFGLSQQALVPLGSGNSGVSLGFQNMMLAAHEIGHNFNGLHKEADKICVDEDLFWCDDYERTIMWPEFLSDNQPRFSDGTHDPAHNNRKRVRDFMTEKSF